MKRFNRLFIYLLGMCVLALGITLNTKTGLGVSPIISVAFCVSESFSLNFGNMTFLLYALFVVVQLFLRDKSERIATLFQIIISLIVSQLLNLFDYMIIYDSNIHGLTSNLLLLLVAIVLTGIGVSLSVNMALVPNPGDGIVQAIAQKVKWEQGFAKNIFDISCVTVTAVMGLLLSGHIIGIGLGTVVAMVGVGRVVALINFLFKDKMCSAAGLIQQGGEETT